MRQLKSRRRCAARETGLVAAVLLIPFAGCQSYERRPLDLAAHRLALGDRAHSGERLEQFRLRLDHLGVETPEAFSFDDGLTLAEGEVAALFYNADLRTARLGAGVALANSENAGRWEDPEFGFDGAEIWSPAAPFEFGLMINLTIPVSGRLEAEKSRADAAYEAELRRIVDAEWTVRHLVRSAWSAWTAAQARADLLRDVVGQVERISALTDQLAAAGELTRVEGRLFQIELAEQRAAVDAAEFEARRAYLELLALIGLPPGTAIELIAAFAEVLPPQVDDALGRIITTNTELAIRRAEYQVAEETLRLEIRKQYPDITIGTGYGNEDDDRLLLGLSLPIPVLNANQQGIAVARAERDVAQSAAEVTFERLAHQYASLMHALDAARMQREQYESSVIPLLIEQASEIERIAELGEVNTLLLLDMVTRQFEAKSRLIALRRSEIDAANAIHQMLGPNSMNAPIPMTDAANASSTATQLDSATADAGGEQ